MIGAIFFQMSPSTAISLRSNINSHCMQGNGVKRHWGVKVRRQSPVFNNDNNVDFSVLQFKFGAQSGLPDSTLIGLSTTVSF